MVDSDQSGSTSTGSGLESKAEDTEDTTCPLCEDFEGPSSSVQAHISGSTDEDHAGRMGSEVMSESGDSDSTDSIGLPSEPDASDELDEETASGGSDENGGSQTEAKSDGNSGVAIAVVLLAVIVLVLRNGDSETDQGPTVSRIEVA